MDVNIEKVVVQFLLANLDLEEIIGENRVSTEIPPNADLPRIRITLTGGTIPVRSYLYSHRITVESWAEDKTTAWDALLECIYSLEAELDGALVENGVVTAVDQESGITWSPDSETNTPRYLTTVRITTHRQN